MKINKKRRKVNTEYLYRINMHQMSRIIPSKGMKDIANKRYSKGFFHSIERYESILEQKYRRISFRKKLKYFISNKEEFKKFFNKSNIYTKIEKVDRKCYQRYQTTNYEPFQYTNPFVPKPLRKMSFSVFMSILGLSYKTKKHITQKILTTEDRKRLSLEYRKY